MNEISKSVRPLVLAAAMAVGLGLTTAACGGHPSQTSAAATTAGSSSAGGAGGNPSTASSTPTTSTTSSAPGTSGTSVTSSPPTASSAVGSTPTIPTTPATTPTTARTSTEPPTRPSPPGNSTTPPSNPIGSPPASSSPAWLADPGGAYGWRQSEPVHEVSADVTSTESICYGLRQATQIEQQAFRADHRRATARLQTFRYADPTAAAAAYNTGLKQMGSCQDELRAEQGRSAAKVPQDATVVTTAALADGHAWSATWTGVATPMSSAGPQVDRVYLVLQGSTVILLDTEDFGAGTPATDDPGVLSALGR